MGKFYHNTRHVDGSHYDFFATKEKALAAMVKSLGYDKDDWDKPLRDDNEYIDDNGGAHIVQEAPSGVNNARTMKALERA